MFQIDKTIISEDLLEKEFVCNIGSCKGECCIAGEAGAPLEADEVAILEEIYPKVKPFLRDEGVAAIEAQGTSITSEWGELETPLIDGAECAYVIFDDKNMALCGIEAAQKSGVIDYKKPISCHLYPVRLNEYTSFTSVNYHSWPICNDACSLGEELKVPVYKFLKESLTRKFGEAWYQKLEKVASQLKK